jgi:hypothetical protein
MTVSQPYSYLGLNNSLLLSSVECLTASILWKNCTTILAYFFNHDKETAPVMGLSLCSVCALYALLVKAVNFQVILYVLVHCGTWVK